MTINTTQRWGIVLVLAMGTLLAGLILRQNRTEIPAHGAHAQATEAGETGDHETEDKKGPHGGKLFTQGDYRFEISIFESGVPPEFRVYGWYKGKPLDPAASQVTVLLERLGRATQEIGFRQEKDYLKGNAIVEEPHSFKVSIKVRHQQQVMQFHYEQIEARVAMSEAQMQQNAVTLGVAGPAKIEQVLQLQGEIKLNEDRVVQLMPRVAGTVESVLVNAGDKVQQGQLLAVLHSAELADLRNQWLAAKQRFELARTSFEREQKLWQEKISPEQDFLQARHAWQEAGITLQNTQQKLTSLGMAIPASKGTPARSGQRPGTGEATRTSDALNAVMSGMPANPARHEVRAPISGTVTAKQVAAGQFVTPERAMLVIADLSTVWAEMAIPVKDLQSVQPGLQARVAATAFAHEAQGKLVFVDSVVGDATRTARARLVLPNPDGQWRPGLPVGVTLVTGAVSVPLAIELAALQTVKDEPAVFGRYGDAFEARPLELGRRDGSRVEVLKGLQAGERYALGNSYLLKADIGKAGASHDH